MASKRARASPGGKGNGRAKKTANAKSTKSKAPAIKVKLVLTKAGGAGGNGEVKKVTITDDAVGAQLIEAAMRQWPGDGTPAPILTFGGKAFLPETQLSELGLDANSPNIIKCVYQKVPPVAVKAKASV